MLVKDLMTRIVMTCAPASSAGEAAETMASGNCGCLPVVDARGRVVGIITDRDISRLVARGRDPWDVPIGDVMSPDVITCRAADAIDVALVAMKENGVRRIPVVDASEHVTGIISIDDVIRHTGVGKKTVPAEAVLDVLRHICAREAPPVVPA